MASYITIFNGKSFTLLKQLVFPTKCIDSQDES